MSRLRMRLANWLAQTDVEQLRRDLVRSQLDNMRLRERLQRSEMTVRAYEWVERREVRA